MSKPASPFERRVRRRVIEIGSLGLVIGLAVVVIRSFTAHNSSMQWISLVLAAVMITVFHLVLQRNHRVPSSTTEAATQRPARPQHNDPFANETDRSWTGLADSEPALPSRTPRNQE